MYEDNSSSLFKIPLQVRNDFFEILSRDPIIYQRDSGILVPRRFGLRVSKGSSRPIIQVARRALNLVKPSGHPDDACLSGIPITALVRANI